MGIMKKLDILKYLEREDKWYLGGGNRLLWAPPFPIWLDYPGFWDKAHYFNYEIEPVFTWTVLDEGGNEFNLRSVQRKWDPSKLKTRFKLITKNLEQRIFRFEEVKCCLPHDVLASQIKIRNKSKKKRKLHLILWTVQPSYQATRSTWISNVEVNKTGIFFTKHTHHLNQSDNPILQIHCSITFNRKIESYSVNLSEGQTIQPHWQLTPFFEKFRNGKLSNEISLSGVDNEGLIFMAIHTSIEFRAESEEQVCVYFGTAPTRKEIKRKIIAMEKLKNPVTVSEKSWNDYFLTVPYFECSDAYLTRYYWYRWYGLRLNTIDVKEGNYKYPFVCEGIGYFRAPISYSAVCHILENRWMHNPKLAQGSLLTFIQNQRKDGGFRGYIDLNYYRQEMFYHANWGKVVRDLYKLHPDKKFLRKAYNGLVKYIDYFDRERDKEKSCLYDIDNHYENGQEYMHRYIAVESAADRDNWGKIFRLKGVDVAVYIYELKKSLAWMAKELNRQSAEVAKWLKGAAMIKDAILKKMWDPNDEMFFDVNPKTGKRTKVKAAVCFYPYMTDIVSEIHVSGLKRHLLNPKEFWTEYPIPSSSVDDKYFSAKPEWKGKRMNCPWNGRVWPMTNSHISEALAYTAIIFNNKELRAKSVELITKFVRMMFFNNDSTLPNCFEHYNPFTGEPSIYRGVDDYQHSWVNDLIIKYVVGIQVEDDCVTIAPFPFQLRYIKLYRLKIRGQSIIVEIGNNKLFVHLNGKKYYSSEINQPIKIYI